MVISIVLSFSTVVKSATLFSSLLTMRGVLLDLSAISPAASSVMVYPRIPADRRAMILSSSGV
jgi:hypothetical protein